MDLSEIFPADSNIQKPGRYLGLEWNIDTLGESDPDRPSILLLYPDIYEIGMSHYGLAVLYQILRSNKTLNVDRCFSPWPDYEQTLRKSGMPLHSITQKLPAGSFDCWCVTIPHELSFTNILNLMDLAGIPLDRSERSDDMPLILGGGIGTMNPEPLACFFDAFYIGDAEVGIKAITDAVVGYHGHSGRRKLIMDSWSKIPGCYVPDAHNPAGMTIPNCRIIRQHIDTLAEAPFPDPPLVPVCRPVHERVVVEIARGCPRTCKFCQARIYYGQVRNRSFSEIEGIISKNLRSTGYDEVSLLSLNTADYPGILELLAGLSESLTDRFISLSLPSLRPERITPAIAEQLQKVRKSGFTLAPEAGSSRLRRIIGKPYDEVKLLESVGAIFAAGWMQLKLYFMIGLPFETDSDITGMISLIRKIRRIARQYMGSKCNINVSISIFVPKPHTPFQWIGQIPDGILSERLNLIRKELKMPGIELSVHDVRQSRLETVFTRGGRELASVLLDAHRAGCRFDSWKEWFDAGLWEKIFREHHMDIHEIATRKLPPTAAFPWDHIDAGVSKNELQIALHASEELSSETGYEEHNLADFLPPISGKHTNRELQRSVSPGITSYIGFHRVTGDYRFFGHLETRSAVIRAFRRAGLPLEYSYGFNPKPRVSFSPPVPFGFEAWMDPVEIKLSEPSDSCQILNAVNRELPMNLHFSKWMIKTSREAIETSIKSTLFGFCHPDPEQFSPQFKETVEEYRKDRSEVSAFLDRWNLPFSIEQYNYFLLIPFGEQSGIKMKSILPEMFGSLTLPFPSGKAVRIMFSGAEKQLDPVFGEF